MGGKSDAEIWIHAAAAMQHAYEQASGFAGFPRNQSCMFTSLTDEKPEYVDGYLVFLKSLLERTPNFDRPILLMHGLKGDGLRADTRTRLQDAYPKTYFVTPLKPPFVPYHRHFRFGDGQYGVQASNEADTNMLYYRLQLFTYGFCRSVVHVDAGDMLVQGDISRLFDDRATGVAGFAAAPVCERKASFNAGLYVVGVPYLSVRAYASIIRVAVNTPRPSRREKRRTHSWHADQDVLNAFFHERRFRTIPYKFNYLKQNVYGGSQTWVPSMKLQSVGICTDSTRPHILHYAGPKPWLPLGDRAGAQDRDPRTVQVEKYWWRAYLSDKTLVLGSGPSLLEHRLGPYINMFRSVVRINNFDLGDADHVGNRTTHAVVHMATKPANFTGIPARNVLFAAFENHGKWDVLQQRVNQPTGTKLDLKTVTVLDPWYFKGLAAEANISPGKHPLTGTVAVSWAVRELGPKPVFVAGFDMMFGSGEYAHYQPGDTASSPSLRIFHDTRHDRSYFRKLEHEGQIRQLRIY